MHLKPLALAASLAFAAVGASAATYNFTMPLAPDAPYTQLVSVSGPSFTDIFNFIAPVAAVGVSGSVVSVDISSFFNIDNLEIQLFDAGNTLVAGGPVGEASNIGNVPVTGGAAYYFEVSGLVPSPAIGGQYVFNAIAAPIPEPGTYALLLGGLGLVGFVSARRRRG